MPELLTIEQVAYAALTEEEGVARAFDNANYSSPSACKKAALAFRNSFYAMKAKASRRELRHNKRDNRTGALSDGSTIYDELSGFLDETETGWRVTICRARLKQTDFFNAKTGEPINWKRTGVYE